MIVRGIASKLSGNTLSVLLYFYASDRWQIRASTGGRGLSLKFKQLK